MAKRKQIKQTNSGDEMIKQLIVDYYKNVENEEIEVNKDIIYDKEIIEKVYDHLMYKADAWINATGICENYDELLAISDHLNRF